MRPQTKGPWRRTIRRESRGQPRHPKTSASQPNLENLMLDKIFERQLDLQVKSYGRDPGLLNEEERSQFIKDMVLAATDELHEALAEVGWKPWATSRHLNRDAFVGELVDVLHFWVNLCLAAGVTAQEVEIRYLNKAEKNAKRQAEGYDGVKGKCPDCHRAYDDIGVYCAPPVGDLPVYCSMAAKS